MEPFMAREQDEISVNALPQKVPVLPNFQWSIKGGPLKRFQRGNQGSKWYLDLNSQKVS